MICDIYVTDVKTSNDRIIWIIYMNRGNFQTSIFKKPISQSTAQMISAPMFVRWCPVCQHFAGATSFQRSSRRSDSCPRNPIYWPGKDDSDSKRFKERAIPKKKRWVDHGLSRFIIFPGKMPFGGLLGGSSHLMPQVTACYKPTYTHLIHMYTSLFFHSLGTY